MLSGRASASNAAMLPEYDHYKDFVRGLTSLSLDYLVVGSHS